MKKFFLLTLFFFFLFAQSIFSKEIVTVMFSPDGKNIISGSVDKKIQYWDVDTGNLIRTFSGYSGRGSVVFSPDGKTIAFVHSDNTVKILDVQNGSTIKTFSGHTNEVRSVAFSPDGKTIVSGSQDEDTTMKLWDVETGKEIKTITDRSWIIQLGPVVFSPDGKSLATGNTRDMDVVIWNIETGKCKVGHEYVIYVPVSTHPSGQIFFNTVNTLAFSPDGKTFISGARSGRKGLIPLHASLKLWDASTAKLIKTLYYGTPDIYSVSFSPDGKTIISGYDQAVVLWDVESGEDIKTFSGHSKTVRSVGFSPDGKTFISGSSDNTIKLWDVETGNEIKTFGQ
ncbi:MAG: WD40 repeat domain-containing protein [Spirochaetaceae bacterium]|nr:WD40 repeat domain-containing protein [Spirochaetaceae bacterium]